MVRTDMNESGDLAATASSLTVSVLAARPGRRQRLIAGLIDAGFSVIPDSEVATVTVIDGPEPSWDPTSAASVYLVQTEAEAGAILRGAGPAGILPTEASPAEIAAAIRAVANRLTVIAPEFLGLLVQQPRELPRNDGATAAEITPREVEVLRLLALGLPNKAIAPRLGITENTVKYHVAAILSKLDAQSRAEAVMLAVRLGLVPL